ncbi:MAG: hypothetical protein ABWZ25_00575 [Chitinophagaceae bacterium]
MFKTKTMFKKSTLSILSLCLMLMVTSCSKDKDKEGSAKIRCKIDGNTKEFNMLASALQIDGGGMYSVSVFGFGDGSTPDLFTIDVTDSAAIKAGLYDEDGGASGRKVASISMQETSTEKDYASTSQLNSAIVTITSISATSVQGTFSGKLSLDGNENAQGAKTVTEGTFNVEF